MNFRTLTGEELARLVDCGNQAAIEYMTANAHDLLTTAELGRDQCLTEAYNNGHADGTDRGADVYREELKERFGEELEECMGNMLGKKLDPDKLGKKRRAAWELLSDILNEFDR